MPLGKADRPGAIGGVMEAPPVSPEVKSKAPRRAKLQNEPQNDSGVVRVIEGFAYGDEFYRKGLVFEASHRYVKKFPQYFGPLEVIRDRSEMVQTTAAPGERRGE